MQNQLPNQPQNFPNVPNLQVPMQGGHHQMPAPQHFQQVPNQQQFAQPFSVDKSLIVLKETEAHAAAAQLREVVDAIGQVVMGNRLVVSLVVATLVAKGHILLEDVPGTGKTQLARALSAAFKGESSRVQFTPDLLPGDITGINIYNQKEQNFEFHAGPIFANIVLADEINRASPKTQSALLEVMAERQVTVEGTAHKVEDPFMVIATQNPVEQAGTYRLPEAQLDRFMVKTSLGYPERSVTAQILAGISQPGDIKPVLDAQKIKDLRGHAEKVYVLPSIIEYVISIMEETRGHNHTTLGVSVRGGMALLSLARVWALVDGRNYVTPDDIRELVPFVFAHRIVMKPESEFDGIFAVDVINDILQRVPAPQEIK